MEPFATTRAVSEEVDLRSALATRGEAFLGPLVSTVAALVRVLEFFDVNDYWFSFLYCYGSRREIPEGTACTSSTSSDRGSKHLSPRYRLSVLRDQFLALKLDVESPPASRAVSEKLGQELSLLIRSQCRFSGSAFLMFFGSSLRPFMAAMLALVGVLEFLYIHYDWSSGLLQK